MKYLLHSLLFAGLTFAAGTSQAVQQCLVIGDSLTKEYEVEFPVLYPENRGAWDARNWIETLHEWRHDWFDLGHFQVWPDVRIVGHKHNWAFPGATTQEIRTRLASTSFLDRQWQSQLKSQIKNEVERVVIIAGGNDADSYYDKIYNGSSPTPYINRTRDNLIWIVDWVRAQRSTIPIILVSVPHVGCAPDVQRQYPTNGIKTTRVSNALASLNSQLATIARSRGVAFVPGVFDFTRAIITQKFYIGSVEINRGASAECDPRYAFSGDGFHPNTPVQAKIAQLIVAAIRARWPLPSIPALTDQEILTKVLGITR